jgi:hypothetical protein
VRRHAPISYSQERLWFIEELESLRDTYNITISKRLKGPLDVVALERSCGARGGGGALQRAPQAV